MSGGSSMERVQRSPRLPLLLVPDADLLGLVNALIGSSAKAAISTTHLSDSLLDSLRLRLLRPKTVRRPLHPLLSPHATLFEQEVCSYQEKGLTVTMVADWAQSLGLPSRHVLALEQAVDELLLNALYDAPRDSLGTPRYAAIPPSDRVLLSAHPGESAWVRFASDGVRLAVGVSDQMGQLRRHTVLSYLARCATAQLRQESPLEEKTSGAGVGLFLTAMAASELLFRLSHGQRTEIVFCQYLSRPRPLRVLAIDDDAYVPPASSPA